MLCGPKTIGFDPDKELGDLLDKASRSPPILEKNGGHYLPSFSRPGDQCPLAVRFTGASVWSDLLLLESSFLNWLKEGLDIHDGRFVERLEVPHANPGVVNREDLHGVQSDRVRPIGRTRAEHSAHGVVLITTRMHD